MYVQYQLLLHISKIILDINPRYCNSTPVDDYDRGGRLFYNRTTPVDAYYHRHRNSISIPPGLYIIIYIYIE